MTTKEKEIEEIRDEAEFRLRMAIDDDMRPLNLEIAINSMTDLIALSKTSIIHEIEAEIEKEYNSMEGNESYRNGIEFCLQILKKLHE